MASKRKRGTQALLTRFLSKRARDDGGDGSRLDDETSYMHVQPNEEEQPEKSATEKNEGTQPEPGRAIGETDIARVVDGTIEDPSDDIKVCLINNRQPHGSFQFPSKAYADKRLKSGEMKRHCKHEWLERYPFLAYSTSLDGLFCLSCVLFPVRAHQGSRAKNLICIPYTNWKNALEDFASHSCLEYHKDSFDRMQAFLATNKDPSSRIDMKIAEKSSATIERNRRFLKSVLRAVEYLGRQGQALRGSHDDGALFENIDNTNKGNFMELLTVMCDSDEQLRTHLETCKRNASYISKTTQNSLLGCIRDFIQGEIVKEMNGQTTGGYFGLVADEVTDFANWEQLGIVIRYTKNNKPLERLVEYVKCHDIRGETIAELLIGSLRSIGLNPDNCRSQTYDGAGNMAGKQKGAARQFQEKTGNYRAPYFHCASHELNLSLSKASKVEEVYNMVCLLQTLGFFFINSPKRQGFLENVIRDRVDENMFNTMKKKVKAPL